MYYILSWSYNRSKEFICAAHAFDSKDPTRFAIGLSALVTCPTKSMACSLSCRILVSTPEDMGK